MRFGYAAPRWSQRRSPSMRSLKMTRKLLFTSAAIAFAVSLAGPLFAGANDYVFEPVKAEVKKGDDVVVSVRLKHKPTGKPVTDAVIVQSRIDMSPDAMGEMASPLTPLPGNEPGVYSFKTDLSMQGRWLLSIAAKVQGEPETVVGKITFRATRYHGGLGFSSLETGSTDAAPVWLQPFKSNVDGHCHDRGLLRALLAWPHDDVF